MAIIYENMLLLLMLHGLPTESCFTVIIVVSGDDPWCIRLVLEMKII